MSTGNFKVSQWSPLKCKNSPSGVKLYYDFSVSATGMFMAVTDLCSIWNLSFDRQRVVEIAREQSCSIDPSESVTQLRTLFRKLKQSLLEGQNDIGHSEHLYEEETRGCLSVRTRLKLPAPLKLLQWTFYLPQRDTVALAESVTFPLLREATAMKQQMETLYLVIRDKDHVLSKLLDKIDNSATDLSLIFPGITGMKSRKHRIDVAEASKHVPGMAPFDRTSWEAGIAESYGDSSTEKIDLTNILYQSRMKTTATIPSANWFQDLPLPDEDEGERLVDHSSSDTDGDVRKIASQRKQVPEVKVDHSASSTESEFEDLADTPRRRARRIEQVKDTGSSPSARGAQAKPLISSSPIPASISGPVSRRRRPSGNSSDSELDDTRRSSKNTSKKAGSKIGMLGGKRKASPAPQSSPPAPVSSNASTPSRKLGVLGGRHELKNPPSQSPVAFKTRAATPDDPDHEAGSDTASSTSSPSASQVQSTKLPIKASTPSPVSEEAREAEESVEEKARRKRAELKRSQAQASASLGKKKVRRF